MKKKKKIKFLKRALRGQEQARMIERAILTYLVFQDGGSVQVDIGKAFHAAEEFDLRPEMSPMAKDVTLTLSSRGGAR